MSIWRFPKYWSDQYFPNLQHRSALAQISASPNWDGGFSWLIGKRDTRCVQKLELIFNITQSVRVCTQYCNILPCVAVFLTYLVKQYYDDILLQLQFLAFYSGWPDTPPWRYILPKTFNFSLLRLLAATLVLRLSRFAKPRTTRRALIDRWHLGTGASALFSFPALCKKPLFACKANSRSLHNRFPTPGPNPPNHWNPIILMHAKPQPRSVFEKKCEYGTGMRTKQGAHSAIIISTTFPTTSSRLILAGIFTSLTHTNLCLFYNIIDNIISRI